jgi:hypothetical protein
VLNQAFDLHRDLQFQIIAPENHKLLLVRFWQIPKCEDSIADQLTAFALILLSARDRSCRLNPLFSLLLRGQQ